jgi:hypothetical protein
MERGLDRLSEDTENLSVEEIEDINQEQEQQNEPASINMDACHAPILIIIVFG